MASKPALYVRSLLKVRRRPDLRLFDLVTLPYHRVGTDQPTLPTCQVPTILALME